MKQAVHAQHQTNVLDARMKNRGKDFSAKTFECSFMKEGTQGQATGCRIVMTLT
jgi:hypothetical protein